MLPHGARTAGRIRPGSPLKTSYKSSAIPVVAVAHATLEAEANGCGRQELLGEWNDMRPRIALHPR